MSFLPDSISEALEVKEVLARALKAIINADVYFFSMWASPPSGLFPLQPSIPVVLLVQRIPTLLVGAVSIKRYFSLGRSPQPDPRQLPPQNMTSPSYRKQLSRIARPRPVPACASSPTSRLKTTRTATTPTTHVPAETIDHSFSFILHSTLGWVSSTHKKISNRGADTRGWLDGGGIFLSSSSSSSCPLLFSVTFSDSHSRRPSVAATPGPWP